MRNSKRSSRGTRRSSKNARIGLLKAGMRWIVERTNSWHNAHKELVWCTERQARVVDFRVAFSDVVIVIGRLIRKAWSLYPDPAAMTYWRKL